MLVQYNVPARLVACSCSTMCPAKGAQGQRALGCFSPGTEHRGRRTLHSSKPPQTWQMAAAHRLCGKLKHSLAGFGGLACRAEASHQVLAEVICSASKHRHASTRAARPWTHVPVAGLGQGGLQTGTMHSRLGTYRSRWAAGHVKLPQALMPRGKWGASCPSR